MRPSALPFFFGSGCSSIPHALPLSLSRSLLHKHTEKLDRGDPRESVNTERAQQQHAARQGGGGIRDNGLVFLSGTSKRGLASTTSLLIIMPEGDGTSRGSPEMAPPSDQYPPSSSSMVPQRAPPVSQSLFFCGVKSPNCCSKVRAFLLHDCGWCYVVEGRGSTVFFLFPSDLGKPLA